MRGPGFLILVFPTVLVGNSMIVDLERYVTARSRSVATSLLPFRYQAETLPCLDRQDYFTLPLCSKIGLPPGHVTD